MRTQLFVMTLAAAAVVTPAFAQTSNAKDKAPAKSSAAYKAPRYVEFREQLPMGATGKVLKRELRATS